MTIDEIVHNRVALTLGDALVRKIALEAQVEILTKQVEELKSAEKPVVIEKPGK